MLPRRHILDIWELIKDKDDLMSMATISLAIDAVKHINREPKKDHFVEALELNEFICYMFPGERPKNRALLFHIVSDLLGLLIYGVPKTRKYTINNIETINYSLRNMTVYPIIEVWNTMKSKVYKKKHGGESIIEGFIKKIRIEMDTINRYPFVEEIFEASKDRIKEWIPSLASYYDKSKKVVQSTYDEWWSLWLPGDDQEKILAAMIDRLSQQAERDFETTIDKEKIFASIMTDAAGNKQENEQFSRWYREGVDLLLKI
ncbi:MAG: hypothetical protein PHC68_16195 [Syntrophorhabdaceae bacterium]|jgi:hypothetical protein|nr:hypothetical protein [Syntrophorhabdaceae bacterium]